VAGDGLKTIPKGEQMKDSFHKNPGCFYGSFIEGGFKSWEKESKVWKGARMEARRHQTGKSFDHVDDGENDQYKTTGTEGKTKFLDLFEIGN